MSKKPLIFFVENSTEFYNVYINVSKVLNLLPERDRENPNAIVLVFAILIITVCMELFQDYLESIPAPYFVTQLEVDE